MSTQATKELETFINPQPDRDFTIHFEIPEFTCLCPKTGQPDFATITIDYVPAELCVELKSLKLYMWSFRDQGAFHEAITNEILNDIVKAIQPSFMRIQAEFNVRGGSYTTIVVEHRKPGWHAPERGDLPHCHCLRCFCHDYCALFARSNSAGKTIVSPLNFIF
jgi:7-cyano-7-deazaguanine reductase